MFEQKKPTPSKITKLEYHDMMKYLEKKYNFEARGFTGIPSKMDYKNHFINWCDKHDLPQFDPDGKDRRSSQLWFKMYNEAEDGEKSKPPYMDFWHYLADQNQELSNGSFIYIPKKAYTKDEDDRSPEKNIEMYRELQKMYPRDKQIRKNTEILIAREEEELKNPVINPWKNWRQEITDLIFKEFGEFAKGDSLKVWVDW